MSQPYTPNYTPYSIPVGHKQNWPLQMGQPLTEPKYSQQQCKCNKRQLGSEPSTPPNQQMH